MGQVYTFKIKGYHRDIGTPQALTQAHLDLTPKHVLSLIAADEEAFYDELPSLK